MGLRELDRLEAAAAQGRGVVAGGDRRSRLPDALDALLRVPALTPKALAARLRIAPQTGTALLRELQGRGGGPGGDGTGEFPSVRYLKSSAGLGCLRIALPPRTRRSNFVASSHVTLIRRGSHPS